MIRQAQSPEGSGLFCLCTIRRPASCGIIQQFFRFQAEPLNGRVDPGPFFRKKLLAFALQQQIPRARVDEHAATPLALDQASSMSGRMVDACLQLWQPLLFLILGWGTGWCGAQDLNLHGLAATGS